MDDVASPARGESVEGETEEMQSQRLEEEFLSGLEVGPLAEREREPQSEDETPDCGRPRRSGPTPHYLLPREQMRFRQTLADPELRDLVEQAWDAELDLHLSLRACGHPAHRPDPCDQFPQHVVDDVTLDGVLLRVGKRVMALAGGRPPEGLLPEMHDVFFCWVGRALLQACYAEGCAAIGIFMGMWDARDYDGLLRNGLISEPDCEALKLWAARDYDGLVSRGVISASEAESYREEDAQRPSRR